MSTATSAFTEDELGYLLGERRLACVATVGADGTPHVVPVGPDGRLSRAVEAERTR